MKHKVGKSHCHFANGKSHAKPMQCEQAFWLALYQPSGGTLCPALGPVLPKRCGTIGESLGTSRDSVYKGRLKKEW